MSTLSSPAAISSLRADEEPVADTPKQPTFKRVELTEADEQFTQLSPQELLDQNLTARAWIPFSEVADFAKDRMLHNNICVKGDKNKKVFCYAAKGGWVPELRMTGSAKEEAAGLRKRMEALFDDVGNAEGISSRRGPNEVANFTFTYRKLVGERFSPRTRHELPELVESGESTERAANVHHLLRTSEQRPVVTPADINARKLTFESIPTDALTKAVYDPNKGQWQYRTEPYQALSHDVWQKQYGDGPITGSVATQREDGIYVLAFDEHVNRMVTDLENMGFPNVERELVVEMMQEHLMADREWIPRADNKFGNRYYLRAKGKSVKFSPALSGPYKELTVAGTPVGDFKVARDKKVNVKLRGRRPVVEQNANRKAETAYEAAVSQLVQANEERKEAGLPGYHEVLFMRTDLQKNGSPNTYDSVTKLQEGASANVAVITVKDGVVTVKTPDPKECGVLPGITVKLALELADYEGRKKDRKMDWKTEYGVVSKQDLENATEVFMTGTAMGIREVGLVDGDEAPVYESKTEGVGPLTQKLINGYEAILAGTHEDSKLNGKMKRVVAFTPANGTNH